MTLYDRKIAYQEFLSTLKDFSFALSQFDPPRDIIEISIIYFVAAQEAEGKYPSVSEVILHHQVYSFLTVRTRLDRLVSEGILIKEEDPAERRRKQFRLSPQAEDKLVALSGKLWRHKRGQLFPAVVLLWVNALNDAVLMTSVSPVLS